MNGTQQATKAPLTFGKRFAVLNLDFMALLIDVVKGSRQGDAFVSNCLRWNDAVHKKTPRPLTIFTTLSLNQGEPELANNAPFTRLIRGFGSFTHGSPAVQVASEFEVDERDVVLEKTRWYAGAGNCLEQILSAQKIDTVILSGLSLSGAVLSTVYRLFDLDYNIFVISDNALELPPDETVEYSKIMLQSLLPKMQSKAISIDEEVQALASS